MHAFMGIIDWILISVSACRVTMYVYGSMIVLATGKLGQIPAVK